MEHVLLYGLEVHYTEEASAETIVTFLGQYLPERLRRRYARKTRRLERFELGEYVLIGRHDGYNWYVRLSTKPYLSIRLPDEERLLTVAEMLAFQQEVNLNEVSLPAYVCATPYDSNTTPHMSNNYFAGKPWYDGLS